MSHYVPELVDCSSFYKLTVIESLYLYRTGLCVPLCNSPFRIYLHAQICKTFTFVTPKMQKQKENKNCENVAGPVWVHCQIL